MVKRIFDLIISIIVLILFSPLLLIIITLIYFFMGRPVVFCQIRPGYKAIPFKFYKFRSMMDKRDASGDLLSDEDRVTFLGKFFRSTSIDELPSLLNVIKGEMSLVGPRPLLIDYIDLYSKEQSKRHNVLPGITGWAQINGRNSISWEEKFKLDLWYIEHRTFLIDMKILLITIWKVLKREGINSNSKKTMPMFKGNK